MMLSVVLVEFLIFLTVVILFLVSAFGWWTERQKRIRMERALKTVEHIQNLSTEVYEDRDREKCDIVNQLVDSWNQTYSAEVGYTMPNIDCSNL